MRDSWLVLVILLGGAWYDVKERRIPNWWSLGAVLCGLGLCALAAPVGEAFKAALGYGFRILAATAVLFPFFLLRVMGAGDIKMMAVMVGCLGVPGGACAISLGFIVGAILALIKMLVQRSLRKRLIVLVAYIRRLFLTKEIVPYYQADRDGPEAVIPFTLCLFAGYLWYMAGKIWF